MAASGSRGATGITSIARYAHFVGGGPAMAIIDVTDPRLPSLAGTFSYSPGEDSE